jgi:hypothetical protein
MFVNKCNWTFWMMIWLVLPTSPLETWSTIYSPPMATSQRSILKTTLNTCAEHGIPNNLLNPCSSSFNIAPISQRQEDSLSGTHSKSTLDMQKYLQLATSWAPVAGGTKNHLLKRLGHNLRPTSPPLVVSTSKCRVNLPKQPGIILTMQLLDKQKNKWLKPPLGH